MPSFGRNCMSAFRKIFAKAFIGITCSYITAKAFSGITCSGITAKAFSGITDQSICTEVVFSRNCEFDWKQNSV